MNIKFSIIVPIYNIENYLTDCIESVLKQKYQNFELILVNDGSTDNSLNICEYYSKKSNKIIIVNKDNGGLVSARKAGLKYVTGNYIVPLDGDDWLHENFLQKSVEIINSHSECLDLICFGTYYAFKDKYVPFNVNSKVGFYTKSNIEEELYDFLIEDHKCKSFSPSVWAKVYRSSLYIKFQNIVDDRITIGEDWACTKPIIYNSNNMFISNEILHYYRQNNTSMTKSKKEFNSLNPFLLKKHFENIFYDDIIFEEQINRNLIHNLFNVFLSKFRTNKDYKTIKKEILEIVNKDDVKSALKKSKYKCLNKGWLAKNIIRFKMIFLIKIIYKFL